MATAPAQVLEFERPLLELEKKIHGSSPQNK